MNKSNKRNIIIPIVLLLIIGVSIFSYKVKFKQDAKIPYTTFVKYLNSGSVSDVYVSDSETIKVKLKNGTALVTQNPRKLDFKEVLLLKGINVHEGSAFNPNAIPVLIFFSAIATFGIYFIAKNARGKGGAFKLSSMDTESKSETGIKFENIAGNSEAKESVKDLVDFIKYPEKYTKYNAQMPRGVILYGAPGTGKTLMAKALATEAGVPFFAVNGSDFVQIYVGVGAGRIRDLFKKASEKGKAVIFIDEIDAIGKKRDMRADGGSDEREQTLNALLSEMSGFKPNQGIIVMAATNRLDVLDEALLRPGRFDRHIEISLPDVKAREEILNLYCSDKPISSNVDLKKVSQMTPYFSGAKLENLVNEAAILAAKENADSINMLHIDMAFNTILAGAEKKERGHIKSADTKITAYHEAGHALITKLMSPENTVRKVTIIPTTKGAGGYTLNIPEDRMYQSKTTLLNNVKVALGGRAAEEIIFGSENITTGAYGDIQSATNTLLAMIKSYGMFETTGLLSYDILESQSISSSSEILTLCSKTINELYGEVKDALTLNIDKLHLLSNKLIQNETLYEEDIESILAS